MLRGCVVFSVVRSAPHIRRDARNPPRVVQHGVAKLFLARAIGVRVQRGVLRWKG